MTDHFTVKELSFIVLNISNFTKMVMQCELRAFDRFQGKKEQLMAVYEIELPLKIN